MKFDKDVSTFYKSESNNYGNLVMMRMHNKFLIYGYLFYVDHRNEVLPKYFFTALDSLKYTTFCLYLM